MKDVVMVRAIEDNKVKQAGMLPFVAGESFAVLAKPSKTFWKGRHKGRVGRFPANKVVEIDDNQQPLDDTVAPADLRSLSPRSRLEVKKKKCTATLATRSPRVASPHLPPPLVQRPKLFNSFVFVPLPTFSFVNRAYSSLPRAKVFACYLARMQIGAYIPNCIHLLLLFIYFTIHIFSR
jgi:hypothetical protein